MADIVPPRIEPLSDTNSEPRDPPPQKLRAKAAAQAKAPSAHVPEISAPGEEDKHDLDEMA